jgi:sporulation protein YabP
MEMTGQREIEHKIVIKDRRLLTVSGVKKVKSFDPKEITLDTTKGRVTIKGRDLGVNNLNLEQSELEIEGQIDMLTYAASGSGESSKGVWEKIFK